MKQDELKMTVILGRGYGDAYHVIKDQPVEKAVTETTEILKEKYGFFRMKRGVPRTIKRRRA